MAYRFVKLTTVGDAARRHHITINIDLVTSLCRINEKTCVCFSGHDEGIWVEETPEEILKLVGISSNPPK